MSETREWTPAFEGQRPPFEPGNDLGQKFEAGNELGQRFEPGNQLAKTHGASSEIALEQPAGLWQERLRELVPVSHQADEPLIALTARVLARLDAAHRWLAEQPLGIFKNDDGELQAVLKAVSTWENSAARFLGMLGCSPATRAQLGLDVARARHAESLIDLAQRAQAEDAEVAR